MAHWYFLSQRINSKIQNRDDCWRKHVKQVVGEILRPGLKPFLWRSSKCKLLPHSSQKDQITLLVISRLFLVTNMFQRHFHPVDEQPYCRAGFYSDAECRLHTVTLIFFYILSKRYWCYCQVNLRYVFNIQQLDSVWHSRLRFS